MATVPVTREIGRAKVDRIQILRARGRTSAQIAADLDLDGYVVDEVFAWHDVLCGLNVDERPTRAGSALTLKGRRCSLTQGF